MVHFETLSDKPDIDSISECTSNIERFVVLLYDRSTLPRYTNSSREGLTRQDFAGDSHLTNNKSPNHLAPGVGSATKIEYGNLSGQPYSKLQSLVLNSSDVDAKVKMVAEDVASLYVNVEGNVIGN
ncbi:hypothetical protein DPMN_126474 [Dreissena polymorpha]|uniref:Uncharacterized protein n=1 Tax=Dreissena polymorpha TaxID=45954 RepID=A0A9D4GXD9_DREPO|nr:hypothetical protein DPMN_126474 [Dreissena polymorpha]